jgi:hypothetical protein
MRGKKGDGLQNDFNFSEIIKKAYEKGISESDVTIQKLMEDLKTDLKKLIIN